jgi:hypothetical protein
MLVLERILAIPDQSVDYLQMGISGGERAALKDRGFVRKDGIKAKDYMIRTIEKTEKAIIKGDKKLGQSAEDKDALERLDRLVKLGEDHSNQNTLEAKINRLLQNKMASQEDANQFKKDLKSLSKEESDQYWSRYRELQAQKKKQQKSDKSKSNKEKKERSNLADLEKTKALESIPEGRLALRVKKEYQEHLKNVELFYKNGMGDSSELDKSGAKLERLSSFSNKLLKLHESAFNPTPAQKNQQLVENNEPLNKLLNEGKGLSEGVRDSSQIPWTLTYQAGDGYKTSTIVGAKIGMDKKGNYIEITRGDSLANMGDHAIGRIKDGTFGNPFLNGGYYIYFPKGQSNTLKAKRLVREMTQGAAKKLDFTFEGQNKKGVIKKNEINALLTAS